MQYMLLEKQARKDLLDELGRMPDYLVARCAGLTSAQAATPGAAGGFSPVEQCWHLADLERDGFGVRIRRLLSEESPVLEDFDGARVAAERDYRSRSVAEGVEAFRQARRDNLALLASLEGAVWDRRGSQAGVGPVALCDMPSMMAQHDASHRTEIEAWLAGR